MVPKSGRNRKRLDDSSTAVRETLHDTYFYGRNLYEAYQDGTLSMTGQLTRKRYKSSATRSTTKKGRKKDNKESNLSPDKDANMEEAPKGTRQSINCPVHDYIKQLTDNETDVAFQDWEVHLNDVRQQRLSHGASRRARTNPKHKVPPNLAFHAFWAYMNKHSSNPKIIPYLYGEMDKIDSIQYECHITDRKTKVKQQQYMVKWADT